MSIVADKIRQSLLKGETESPPSSSTLGLELATRRTSEVKTKDVEEGATAAASRSSARGTSASIPGVGTAAPASKAKGAAKRKSTLLTSVSSRSGTHGGDLSEEEDTGSDDSVMIYGSIGIFVLVLIIGIALMCGQGDEKPAEGALDGQCHSQEPFCDDGLFCDVIGDKKVCKKKLGALDGQCRSQEPFCDVGLFCDVIGDKKVCKKKLGALDGQCRSEEPFCDVGLFCDKSGDKKVCKKKLGALDGQCRSEEPFCDVGLFCDKSGDKKVCKKLVQGDDHVGHEPQEMPEFEPSKYTLYVPDLSSTSQLAISLLLKPEFVKFDSEDKVLKLKLKDGQEWGESMTPSAGKSSPVPYKAFEEYKTAAHNAAKAKTDNAPEEGTEGEKCRDDQSGEPVCDAPLVCDERAKTKTKVCVQAELPLLVNGVVSAQAAGHCPNLISVTNRWPDEANPKDVTAFHSWSGGELSGSNQNVLVCEYNMPFYLGPDGDKRPWKNSVLRVDYDLKQHRVYKPKLAGARWLRLENPSREIKFHKRDNLAKSLLPFDFLWPDLASDSRSEDLADLAVELFRQVKVEGRSVLLFDFAQPWWVGAELDTLDKDAFYGEHVGTAGAFAVVLLQLLGCKEEFAKTRVQETFKDSFTGKGKDVKVELIDDDLRKMIMSSPVLSDWPLEDNACAAITPEAKTPGRTLLALDKGKVSLGSFPIVQKSWDSFKVVVPSIHELDGMDPNARLKDDIERLDSGAELDWLTEKTQELHTIVTFGRDKSQFHALLQKAEFLQLPEAEQDKENVDDQAWCQKVAGNRLYYPSNCNGNFGLWKYDPDEYAEKNVRLGYKNDCLCKANRCFDVKPDSYGKCKAPRDHAHFRSFLLPVRADDRNAPDWWEKAVEEKKKMLEARRKNPKDQPEIRLN